MKQYKNKSKLNEIKWKQLSKNKTKQNTKKKDEEEEGKRKSTDKGTAYQADRPEDDTHTHTHTELSKIKDRKCAKKKNFWTSTWNAKFVRIAERFVAQSSCLLQHMAYT